MDPSAASKTLAEIRRHVDMGNVTAPLIFAVMLHNTNNINVGGAVLPFYADDLAIWKAVPRNLNKGQTRKRSVTTYQAAVDRAVAYMRDSSRTLSPEKNSLCNFFKQIW